MSIFHPINGLNQLSSFYNKHAEILLQLFMETVLTIDKIDIGYTNNNGESTSIISFPDELNEVLLELRYEAGNLIISVFEFKNDRGENADFKFTFNDESNLWKKIPSGLINMMQEVEQSQKAMTYVANSIDN